MKKEETPGKGEIVIYQSKDGSAKLEAKLENETIWLTQKQIAELFNVGKAAISKHTKNIFQEGELTKNPTVSILETVQSEGGRSIKRKLEYFNLDFIISVGYRVNSKRATQFRIWATNVLRNHIVKGFTINQNRLKTQNFTRLNELEKAVGLLKGAIQNKQLNQNEASGLLSVISDYANSWILLQKYDKSELKIKKSGVKKIKPVAYDFAADAIKKLKMDLIKKKEAAQIFGQERDGGLSSILGNLEQTFAGKQLYPSIEEKAAHLLYFVIKNHPFVDGNKRIASFLFIIFISRNNYLLNKKGEKKINDNALVALALLVAESRPGEKEIMISLITNLL